MQDHPSNRTPHCWHLSGTQFGNVSNFCLLADALVFAWEEQVKKHGRKCGSWQFLARCFYWVLFLFFVFFCFNESLLSCCQLWSKPSCTESLNFPLHRDMRLHHPRLNAMCGYFQLLMLGKLTQSHCMGEWWSQSQTGAPDQVITQLLPWSPFSVKPLCLCLTPSPRQLHMAEKGGEKRNRSSNRRQLQCLNFYCLHAVIPNKASP